MNITRPIRLGWMLAITAFTIWLYWPCTENEFLRWDDEPYIAQAARHATLSLDTLRWAFGPRQLVYYHPLALLSHALDCRLWGLNPAGHHATNVVLHGANTALVFWLVWLLAEGVRERLALAVGVAVVFGIHPLQVESVAWIAERKNVLCGFFSLATLCAYVRGWRWATLVLFAAALLSKPMAVSLPVVMLAIDVYPLGRHRALGVARLVKEKVVLFALSAWFCVITLAIHTDVGAVMGISGRGLGERVLVAMRGVVFYLWKLIWPAWLSPYYPLAGTVSLAKAEYLLGVGCFVSVTALCVWRWRREPARLAAWIGFLALIIPVSGLFQSGTQAAADRFMYLAMLPLVLLIAGGCVWAWRRLTLLGRLALAVLLVCQLAFFAFRARGQCFVWHNDETMWRSVLVHFPNSGLANQALAQVLVDEGRIEEALDYARHAVEVAPWVGNAHSVLASVCLEARRYEDAAREAERALQLDRTLPQPHWVLACAYTKLADFEKAFENLREWLSAQPHFAAYAATAAELTELREHPQFRQQFLQLVTSR